MEAWLDFIFYPGLFSYFVNNRRSDHGTVSAEKRDPLDRPVMFLHVPGGDTQGDIERGVEVTVGLVRALVGSWVDRGAGFGKDNGVVEAEGKGGEEKGKGGSGWEVNG